MRYADQVRSDRVRPLGRRRDPEPTPYDSLLALQHSAGNHAVARRLARTFTVNAIDVNPLATSGPTNADVPVAAFKAKLNAGPFVNALQGGELTRWRNLANHDFAEDDMARLADAIIRWIATDGAPVNPLTSTRLKKLMEHRQAVEDALGTATPRASGVSEGAERIFDEVLGVASEKSRAKGAPSRVGIGSLKGEMNSGVKALRDNLKARNDKIKQHSFFTTVVDTPSGLKAGEELPVRSGHTNAAGWLRQHAVPTQFDTETDTWVQDVQTHGNAGEQQEITTAFGAAAVGVTARDVESSGLSTALKRRFYREVFTDATNVEKRRVRHAWREYAAPILDGCPYVEFTGDGCGGLSRVVWDLEDDKFYIGIHYKWVHGYNPFFVVDGLAATY